MGRGTFFLLRRNGLRLTISVAALVLLGPLAIGAETPPAPGALFNVRDYGARGDGSGDDAAAINRAMAAAVKQGPGATVFLPAGTYALGSPGIPGRGAHLILSGADGLTVKGEKGTVLMWRDMSRDLMRIAKGRNVTVRDLTLDANPLPYTQGVITAVDPTAHTVDLQVGKGYDDLDRPDFNGLSEFRICDSDFDDGWKEDQYFPHIQNRQRLGADSWRITISKGYQVQPGLVGRRWMAWPRTHRGWSFLIGDSTNCTVEDVRIYATGSGAFSLYHNPGNVTVRHVYLGPPPGSDRIFCGGGGAMSFFNRGTVTVEECDFSHVDDDDFNLGSHFVRVVEKIDPSTCRAEAWPGDFQAGDTVALWDWQNKTVRLTAKVVEARQEPDKRWWVRFDRAMPFGQVGPGPARDIDFHKQLTAQEFDGIDRLADLDSAGSCILRGNTMSSMRARCFLVKTQHSLIENNVFHDTHMPAILAGPEFFWGEGPELTGLEIRGNTFRNIDEPNISVATFVSPTGTANRAVTIENNVFEDYGRTAVIYMTKDPRGAVIHVQNTDGVVIRHNRIGARQPGCPEVDPIQVDPATCRAVQVSQ